jgi:hypothetical protein
MYLGFLVKVDVNFCNGWNGVKNASPRRLTRNVSEEA